MQPQSDRLAGASAVLFGNSARAAVQQATKVELIINMKPAEALGLTVPESILFRADKVIQ